MLSCVLPYPPSALRPNAVNRQYWQKSRTAAALYKSLCAIELREQGLGKVDADRLHLTIQFCPPDARRRDLDNMLASVKHGIDAISDAVGVDDYHFGFTISRGPVVKGGEVRISITEDW